MKYLGKFTYCTKNVPYLKDPSLWLCACDNCEGSHCGDCSSRIFHDECEYNCPECCIDESTAKQMELSFELL